MVKTYSLKKDGETTLGKYFKVKEFACNDGTDRVLISDELVQKLERIREYFNAPVTINSAYRTTTYNRKIGGASNSQHCLGIAADIAVKGITPAKVQAEIESGKIFGLHTGGLGSYKTFTHIDVRNMQGKPARWRG